eukprot:CAMPEP_0115286508 /NCGR_PEP_ID=MMETSP0270-20121206/61977_1 /TAXON_ID=71861 /ORGANISM="Scrippsiella trochoidea, Strain CCMP3099" /LENGTH=57 /DNA_ID=CAMNT_0002703553 /DNA_START=870 /DNA_END=1043 /DNA_ORIENTATION=-
MSFAGKAASSLSCAAMMSTSQYQPLPLLALPPLPAFPPLPALPPLLALPFDFPLLPP